MDWNAVWGAIQDFIINSGPKILMAIVAFILGIIIVKIIIKLLNVWLKRSRLEPTTRGFLNSAIKIILYAVLVLIILQILGVPLTGLTAVVTTAGVAIALALKDSLSNVAYGMILVSTKPFKQGDYVKIGAVEGTVRSIEIMATEIITIDNKLITIPNHIVYSDAMINYSALKKRRMDMYFTVAYNSDIEKIRKIMLAVCHSNGYILTSPAPEVHIHSYDGNNMRIFMFCWSVGKYWDVYYYLMDNVYNELARNGIAVNPDRMEVRMCDEKEDIKFIKKPLPKRIEPKPVETEEFNLFDIETFSDLGDKIKKQKLKRLKKQKAQIESELGEIEKTLPAAKIRRLIETNSIMLKKHSHTLRKTTVKTVFTQQSNDNKEQKKTKKDKKAKNK